MMNDIAFQLVNNLVFVCELAPPRYSLGSILNLSSLSSPKGGNKGSPAEAEEGAEVGRGAGGGASLTTPWLESDLVFKTSNLTERY